MQALKSIGWAILVLVNLLAIFELVGFAGLTRMFPEGKRAWHLPAQLASLVVFAVLVLNHPF